MKRIIVGGKSFEILKIGWGSLPKDKWSNYSLLKFRVKVTPDLKLFLEKSLGEEKQDIHLVKGDGIYLCQCDFRQLQGLSRFPDKSELCQITIILWSQKKVSKQEEREFILNELGI